MIRTFSSLVVEISYAWENGRITFLEIPLVCEVLLNYTSSRGPHQHLCLS